MKNNSDEIPIPKGIDIDKRIENEVFLYPFDSKKILKKPIQKTKM